MNKGKFSSSINECISLLKNFDNFLKDSRPGNIKSFSKEYMDISRSGDYIKIYNTVTKNSDYTILLKDDSFFQFHLDSDNDGGYIFMQNPRCHPDFDTFLLDFYGNEDISDEDLEQLPDLYDQYLDEQSLNSGAVYMRMDFEEKTYTNFLHSFAHLHININSDIRIPLDKVLSPLAFCSFVLKHVYYQKWEEQVKKGCFDSYKNKLKEILCDHPKDCWSDEDKLNLFLT